MDEKVQEENREHLEMIRKAMELVEKRAFCIMNSISGLDGTFYRAFTNAHEELSQIIIHLADLAGVEIEAKD